ncbi:response regulator transcription factor [Marinobacter pelagius]|uniref:DNA-binding response regulator, NarL/FixJ family, contains REC and HTH domains n=1 Tax=Marinobacter pelagius TaxID=379482 RepID=A0A1I4VUP1_9GAMM|nr:response regulator transcription factor [Marinobacter pelagius]SFN04737.1 DNA-binding response regulator, NarL/FixJ family, contains REC and HTH domains [Marinobacter pelagius]
MAQQGIESAPRVLAVSDYSALTLGLEAFVCSNRPQLEWAGVLSDKDSLARASEVGANIIVTDLDSPLGRDCVALLGPSNDISIVALAGSATEVQIDAAVIKGLKGVVQKRAPNQVLLKAILAVHRGELWLDRLVTSRILRGLTTGETHPANLPDRLTKKEQVIYNAVINRPGTPSRLIANDLHISEHTLRNHLTAIYSKLGVSGRLELMALAHDETPPTNPDTGPSD